MDSNQWDDPYTILGLARSATPAEIRRAYRRLCLVHHPDRNEGSEQSREQFEKISRAYRTLSSQTKKQTIDSIFSVRVPPKPPLAGETPRVAKTPAARMVEGINALEPADALTSAVFAAGLFPFFFYGSLLAPNESALWEVFLLSTFSMLCALFGILGTRRFWPGELATEILSLLIGAGLPPLLIGLLSEKWSGCAGLPLFGSIFSAGCIGWVAASIGRAFAHSPKDYAHPLVGLAVAAILAGLLGFLVAALITSATSDVFGGLRFFALVGCSSGASALGAAFGAARGALRNLRDAA